MTLVKYYTYNDVLKNTSDNDRIFRLEYQVPDRENSSNFFVVLNNQKHVPELLEHFTIHEIIGPSKQRLYFDLDMQVITPEKELKLKEQEIGVTISTALEKVLISLGVPENFVKISIYSSSYVNKISLHFITPFISVDNNELCKALCLGKLLGSLPSIYCAYIDKQMYKYNQNLRIVGSRKLNTSRIKLLAHWCKNYNYSNYVKVVNEETFNASSIARQNMIIGQYVRSTGSEFVTVLKRILKYEDEYKKMYPEVNFPDDRYSEGQYCVGELRCWTIIRNKPSFCIICGRDHGDIKTGKSGDNMWVVLGKKNETKEDCIWRLYCRRNENNRRHIVIYKPDKIIADFIVYVDEEEYIACGDEFDRAEI